jgi:glycosyltransferase involved in cell wall biosynthesis
MMTRTPDRLPELSVIIPAFNAETTLPAQLDALSRQDVSFAWEILLCDNGSTDSTREIASRWSDRLPGLVVVDASSRRGPAAARNAGARQARSPALAFCDADDVIADDWVSNMFTALQDAELVAGVATKVQLGSAADRPEHYRFGPYRISHFPWLLAAAANNLGVRRETFELVGGFDETLRTGEDDDLCWRIQLAGYPLVTRPELAIQAGSREGLHAVFKQAFGYGRGDRQLTYKYAKLIAALRADDGSLARNLPAIGVDLIDSRTETAGDGRSALRRRAARLARVRRASDFASLVHRLGIAIGFRVGRMDRATPQLDLDVIRGGRMP